MGRAVCRVVAALLIVTATGLLSTARADPILFWTQLEGGVHRSNLDGSNDSVIANFPADEFQLPSGIQVDSINYKVYFSSVSRTGTFIRRMNFDGSELQDLVSVQH